MSQFLTDNQRILRWMAYFAVAVLVVIWLTPMLSERAPYTIVQRTVSGILLGGIYAIIALGIVVINKASGVFNFAHGAMMMISAFIFFAFFSNNIIPPMGAFLLALVTVVMIFTTSNLQALLKPLNLMWAIIATILLTLGMSLSASTNATLTHLADASGTYIAEVTTYDHQQGVEELPVGQYTLVREIEDGEGQSAITNLTGNVNATTPTVTHEIELQEGERLDLIARSSRVDTVLTLYTLDGSVIATDDDGITPHPWLYAISPDVSKSLAGITPRLAWVRALIGAITGTVLIGLLIERFTIRPLIGQPVFAAVMVTLALAEILSGVTTLIWGPQPKPLTIFGQENAFVPGTYSRITESITINTTALMGGNIEIDLPRLYAFLIALGAFAAFFIFFQFTNIGLAMRATSENQQLAESVGLRVRVILAITWAVAALLAGIAAILHVGASDSNSLTIELQYLALRAFPAVLLGGLESIGGALLGGLILGLTEEWSKMLFGGEVSQELAPYVVLMIILILRPEGLFGEKRIERI